MTFSLEEASFLFISSREDSRLTEAHEKGVKLCYGCNSVWKCAGLRTMKDFQGYHAEWNLGCPGGWEYQRMAQERGKLCWNKVKEISGTDIELIFDHPLLNPVPHLLDMLLRAHRARFCCEKPFIVLVAEEETRDKVTENVNVVGYLNRLEGVTAALTSPEQIERRGAYNLPGARGYDHLSGYE